MRCSTTSASKDWPVIPRTATRRSGSAAAAASAPSSRYPTPQSVHSRSGWTNSVVPHRPILELQRALGLRETEAIRGGKAETLARWQRELQGAAVCASSRNQGRTPRDVHPADLERARAAIERAQATLKATGQRYLVTRADGTATTGLKQALGIYRNVCHRAGIQSHAARYAFAQERMQAYRQNEGYSEREARAATSLDLGHGDGRGRYIASVYARGG